MYWDTNSQYHKHSVYLSPIEAAWPSESLQACGRYMRVAAYNKKSGYQKENDFTPEPAIQEGVKIGSGPLPKSLRR